MSDAKSLLPCVAKAAEIVGSLTKLAEKLGVSRPALYQWRKVPAERVIALETASGGKVTRHEIRPDLYPLETAA